MGYLKLINQDITKIQKIYKTEDNLFKAEEFFTPNGVKNKYLSGIVTGTKVDGDGERITDEGIFNFLKQFDEKDILLYNTHEFLPSDDIGIAVEKQLIENFDKSKEIFVKFRLYNRDDLTYDGVCDERKLAVINNIWKQAKGIFPYTKPAIRGFSIDAGLRREDIVHKDMYGRKTIKGGIIDGFALVPRQAYPGALAGALEKKLMNTTLKEKLKKQSLSEKMQTKMRTREMKRRYHDMKWEIENALDDVIEEILTNIIIDDNQKMIALNSAFDEYKQLMISHIMQNEEVIEEESIDKSQTLLMLKDIQKKLEVISKKGV